MVERALTDRFATVDTGNDLLSLVLDADGLGYEALVDRTSDRGRNADVDGVDLLAEDGDALVSYVELETGESPSAFLDRCKDRGTRGLFAVVGRRVTDGDPLTTPLADDVTFVAAAERTAATARSRYDLRTVTVARSDLTPASADCLAMLSVAGGEERASVETAVEDCFSAEAFTDRFYESFETVFEGTLRDAVHGLDGSEERTAYARTLAIRLLFALFVQRTGWFDGDERYVQHRYDTVRATEGMDPFEDWLAPFFRALSEPDATTDAFLGDLPFLNEGLFERWDETDVRVDPAFFDALLAPGSDASDSSPGLFRCYEITLAESSPGERELAVDPGVVGRLFELFMRDDDRSAVGAFYTPKSITTDMARTALVEHLRAETPITREQAATLVTTRTVPDGLSPDQIGAVSRSLRSVTVLDPAVGSGAFAVAVLETLADAREAVDRHRGVEQSPADRKREVVSDSLFGVDVDAGSVECCRFRVWIHLLRDSERTHETVVAADGPALPNLERTFFVGNSLAGELAPAELATDDALTDDLAETIDEFVSVRDDARTACGARKAELDDRLDRLGATLTEGLAPDDSDHWMTDVAAAADDSFAWTAHVPDVLRDGGFDVVIGNPPYEGGSRQPYVGALAGRYDERYDCYESIPRMRHDLYQQFVVRGWELTRPGGTLSYLTSSTFYTLGSKRPTRRLLQSNRLRELVRVDPAAFDAAVEPAVFTLQKVDRTTTNYRFDYVDATGVDHRWYRSVRSALAHAGRRDADATGTDDTDAPRPKRLSLPGSARGYRVGIDRYRGSLRRSFFEPTDRNCALADSVVADAQRLITEWAGAIRDSNTLDEHREAIRAGHLDALEPGDVSILGLLTVGGQGLATGDNESYLAYLDGTPGATEVRARNAEFAYGTTNEQPYRWLSRVVRPSDTVDVAALTDEQARSGIDPDADRTWVPIIKGKGDPYYAPITQYVDWSMDALEGIREDGLLRNRRYYFEAGIFVSRGGTGRPVVRYAPPAAVDSSGGKYIPTYEGVSAKYLNGLLNAAPVQHVLETFLNDTVNTQIQDMRVVPVVVPTDDQRERMAALVDEAIAVCARDHDVADPVADLDPASVEPRTLSAVTDDIDALAARIYGV